MKNFKKSSQSSLENNDFPFDFEFNNDNFHQVGNSGQDNEIFNVNTNEESFSSKNTNANKNNSIIDTYTNNFQNEDCIKYKEQLATLHSMGFKNISKNIEALKQSNGNVELAINSLVIS